MRRAARFVFLVSIASVLPLPAAGQDATTGDAGDSGSAPATRALDLDRLLKPRDAGPARPDSTHPGGKDRETWQRQFDQAYTEIGQLRQRLDESQRRMREVAGDTGYTYSPTGGGETYDPDVLKLRAQVQRDRQSLEAAERRLRELRVEASLAGVPEAWLEPAAQAPEGRTAEPVRP